MAGQPPENISMMARIAEIPDDVEPHNDTCSKVTQSTQISALSMIENNAHIWLINSAASSHISGNIDLFSNLHSVTPITIETASGEAFTVNQRGTICITLCSDPMHNLSNIPIILLDVIYVPKLNVNLMSVGRMTNANIEVILSREHSSLILEGSILAREPKISNLFTNSAYPTTKHTESANYSSNIPEATLWHHILAHANYSTLEKMAQHNIAIGLNTEMKFEPISQCTHCPFSKQTQAPFKGTENMQKEIGNMITLDLCGPFKSSIGGYKYFVTWIDIKSRYASVDFLKNKECTTISDSFKRYLAWITRQKQVSVKRV